MQDDRMSSAIRKKPEIDPIDLMIGKRLRILRNRLGITQEGLAGKLGVSFQQVQKYESGENKIYASRLYHISKVLKKEVSYFFEEDSSSSQNGLSDQGQEFFQHNEGEPAYPLDDAEARILLRAYSRIEDKRKRKTAVDMIKGLTS